MAAQAHRQEVEDVVAEEESFGPLPVRRLEVISHVASVVHTQRKENGWSYKCLFLAKCCCTSVHEPESTEF